MASWDTEDYAITIASQPDASPVAVIFTPLVVFSPLKPLGNSGRNVSVELRQIPTMNFPQKQMAKESVGISISKDCAHISLLTVIRDTEA